MIKAFEAYGVEFTGKSGTQVYGTCPFCDKPGKFYVNSESFLWDCKVCGVKGNFNTFLEIVYNQSLKDTTEGFLKKLSIDRKLPLQAFRPWKFGKFGEKYILPVRDPHGKIQDLRTFSIGGKMMSTAGCHTGLLNMEKLAITPENSRVWVCEGEWDCMAMSWLLKFLDEPGICVGVPGAGTFKREWSSFFSKKNVVCCYDNDDAGAAGELVAQDRLTGVAKTLKYIRWPETFPDGYDVRDLIAEKAIKHQKPRTTSVLLNSWSYDVPRRAGKDPSPVTVVTVDSPPPEKVTIEEVYEVFRKWLFIKDFRGLDVALSTMISNDIPGDPIWMFIVSSPGGSKTELLQACNKCDNVYVTSSLTSKSLISGSSFTNGKDPSLLPRLHGKTLIIKDFTTILSKREQEKEEIFGIFRDAYDGSSGKVFGNGQERVYVCHFSVLAAVTPKVHELAVEHQSFGERFLKFSLGDNLNHQHEEDMIAKAMNNVGSENSMRPEMAEIVRKFLAYKRWEMKTYTPVIPPTILNNLTGLAMFGARMRGVVSRDRYRSDIMLSKPSAEYGTRLAKQVAKLTIASCYLRSLTVATNKEYSLMKKVVLDTIPQRLEDVFSALYRGTQTIDDTMTTKEVAAKTSYTLATASQVLQDLNILGIVVKTGKSNAYEWSVSKYVRDLIKKSEVYD